MIMSNYKIHHKIFNKSGQPAVLAPELIAHCKALISRYPQGKQKSALLPVLHMAQEYNGGFLDVATMDAVAEMLQIQPIEVYEVATFYTQYYLEATGKYVIEVCQTGPCAACGAEDMIGRLEKKLDIKAGETTPDKLFTLRTVECLGACGYAPAMQINTKFYEQLNDEKIDQIIDELRQQSAIEKTKEETWAGKFCLNI